MQQTLSMAPHRKSRSNSMKTKFFRHLLVTLLVLLSCTLAFAEARPQVGKYAKVYKGSEGLYLIIVKIGPAKNNEVMFLLEGIDHPWDGKIMIAKANKHSNKIEYVIQVDGSDYVVFINRSGSGEVYLDKTGSPQRVYYDEDRSMRIIPEHILTIYLKQIDK
jgi:hypothetical protein